MPLRDCDSSYMTAVQNPQVRTFRVGQFMCATTDQSSEAAMALIRAPGGTAQRMHARLKAVEILVRNGAIIADHSVSGSHDEHLGDGEESSWRAA